MGYDAFVEDEKTVDAVVRNFEVMGEATKNLPDWIYEEYDEVPWTEMAGLRDTLIHGYATIDLRIVWTTIEEEIPALLSQIRSILDDVDG